MTTGPILAFGVYEFLMTEPALLALHGGRVYPVRLPLNPVFPALTFWEVAGVRSYTQTGATGLVASRIQVDSWSTQYTQAKRLSEQVRLAMSGFNGYIGGANSDLVKVSGCFVYSSIDLSQTEVDKYHIMLDLGFNTTEVIE